MIATAPPPPDERPGEKTLTIICAFDGAEAEQVRREAGLTRGNSIYPVSAESFHGLLRVEVYVIETPRFCERPDAGLILRQLRSCCAVQKPHPSQREKR
ncbi:hypothetical protein [Streptosporangium sp. NPDC002524]|uniref:hypothetical protein n=1 Tax=Streptosporangium sp. NPDC002524 TaxID=3154537 RepID=UPI00332FEDE9